jgi:hypothetical protein
MFPRLARSRRKPAVEARLLGELGKIGSNVNHYAKSRNMGRDSDSLDLAMEAALRDLLELRHACLQAIGQEPRRRGPMTEDDLV